MKRCQSFDELSYDWQSIACRTKLAVYEAPLHCYITILSRPITTSSSGDRLIATTAVYYQLTLATAKTQNSSPEIAGFLEYRTVYL